MRLVVTLAVMAGASGALFADLERIKREPNLEKRSWAAVENAQSAAKQAREAYEKGEMEQTSALLGEVLESVVLADESLRQTNKNPRKSPKYFKKAEMGINELLRRLDFLAQEMSVADRPLVEKIKPRLQQIHRRLLEAVMGGKR